MQERIWIICVGFFMDILFGDPYWLWHPVRFVGKLITGTEQFLRKVFQVKEEGEADREKKRRLGILLVVFVIGISLSVQWGLLFLAGNIHRYCKFGLECFWCYQFLAMKSLKVESMKVYRALNQEDMEGARRAVSMIVGRDTKSLNKKGITRAAVETVAENTSDGVIAPLLFLFCFGVQGGLLYKTVNTMDSMIGYRNEKYQYLGTAAAKLDDVLNYIPARVSAIFMLVAAFFQRLDYKNGFRIFLRDRYNHKSPNSAQTEAVCAGVLNIELAGNAWYFGKLYEKPTIGDNNREIEPFDICRANRLMYGTSFLTMGVGILVLWVSSFL